MDYEFNSILATKKKSNKLRNFLIAALLFFSIIAVRELAAANFHAKEIAQPTYAPASKSFVENFSYSSAKKGEALPSSEDGIFDSGSAALSAITSTATQISNFIFQESPATEKPEVLFLNRTPENMVILIIDGAGGYYINEETTPNLLEIAKYSFFTTDMRALIPSTTESHSIIFSGIYNESYDWQLYLNETLGSNKSLFDIAKSSNYKIFTAMGSGNSKYLDEKADFSFKGMYNNTFKADNEFDSYNLWVKNSTIAALENLSSENKKFILVANLPGVDKAGHDSFNLYLPTLRKADAFVGEIFSYLVKSSMLNNTALLITSDHGMQKAYTGRGAHSDIYTDKTLKVPFLLLSPNIQPQISTIPYTNDNIFPTIARLLNLTFNWSVAGFSIQEIFSNEQPADIGIINLTYENPSIISFVKNYVNSTVDDEICLNVSQKERSAIACSDFSLQPFEERQFSFRFPFSEAGYYKSFIFMNRSDNNPKNDNMSLEAKIGQIHDLGISNITVEQNNETPSKITVKVKVLNYGDFDESSLSLSGTINGETREYGPYSSAIKRSKTVTTSWTLSSIGNISISFEITGYDNFASDYNEENNIKATSIHINAGK